MDVYTAFPVGDTLRMFPFSLNCKVQRNGSAEPQI